MVISDGMMLDPMTKTMREVYGISIGCARTQDLYSLLSKYSANPFHINQLLIDSEKLEKVMKSKISIAYWLV